jgi:Flp pilus assembly protein CpaB
MRAVRYLLRIGVLTLAGFAFFCGMILLLHAQAALNRYAELYMSDGELMPTATSAGPETATASASPVSAPAPPSVNSEPVHANSLPALTQRTSAAATPTEAAIAVRVGNAQSLADIAPADRRVDVVLTYRSANGAAFSEVVLENVRVLTIEPIIGQGDGSERTAMYSVTLDVDAESAQNLLLASHAGTLSLVLHEAKGDRPSELRREAIPALAQGEPTPARDEPAHARNDSAPARDDPRFTEVRVNRIGGATSTHRVPREQ